MSYLSRPEQTKYHLLEDFSTFSTWAPTTTTWVNGGWTIARTGTATYGYLDKNIPAFVGNKTWTMKVYNAGSAANLSLYKTYNLVGFSKLRLWHFTPIASGTTTIRIKSPYANTTLVASTYNSQFNTPAGTGTWTAVDLDLSIFDYNDGSYDKKAVIFEMNINGTNHPGLILGALVAVY